MDSVYINPYDISAHEILAEVCEKTSDTAGLDREKRVIADLTRLKEEQEKAEDDLYAGTGNAQLVEQLDRVPVEPFGPGLVALVGAVEDHRRRHADNGTRASGSRTAQRASLDR